MTRMRLLSLVVVPAALLTATTGVAYAEDAPAAPNFGQHVSSCAQTMGFAASHNPGMHRGFAGWDGMP